MATLTTSWQSLGSATLYTGITTDTFGIMLLLNQT